MYLTKTNTDRITSYKSFQEDTWTVDRNESVESKTESESRRRAWRVNDDERFIV